MLTNMEVFKVQTSVYIAGQMTGVADFNRNQFNAVRNSLEILFDKVVSPVDLAIREYGDSLFNNPTGCQETATKVHGFDRYEMMKINTKHLSECNYIYMLEGWEKSAGAKLELGFACNNGINVLMHNHTMSEVLEKIRFWHYTCAR